MRRGTVVLATGLAIVLAGVSGCGSGSHTSASPPAVDISKLDVGGYSTVPRPHTTPSLPRAELSEGQRLASYLPLPMDIDPQFKYQSSTNPLTIRGFLSDSPATGLATDNIADDAPGFVAGFSIESQSDTDIGIATVLHYEVMIFTDDKAANNGAASLAAKQFNRQAVKSKNQATTIDGHPETHAVWRPDDDAIESFTPTGVYVIYTSIYNNAMQQINSVDSTEISGLTEKTIESELLALKNFKPVPLAQLTDIAVDNTGIGAITVPKEDGDEGLDLPGIYDQRGALMLSDFPATDKNLYTRTGMDWMASNAGRVYRTKDAAAAAELLDARSVVPRIYKIADSPPSLPEASCDEYKGGSSDGHPRFHCAVAYSRYVAEMWSEQLIDVHQRISAQYALLTKSNR